MRANARARGLGIIHTHAQQKPCPHSRRRGHERREKKNGLAATVQVSGNKMCTRRPREHREMMSRCGARARSVCVSVCVSSLAIITRAVFIARDYIFVASGRTHNTHTIQLNARAAFGAAARAFHWEWGKTINNSRAPRTESCPCGGYICVCIVYAALHDVVCVWIGSRATMLPAYILH